MNLALQSESFSQGNGPDPEKGAKAQVYPFPYAMEIRRLIEQERIAAARSLLKHALSQGSPTPDLLQWQEILAPARVRKSSQLDRDRSPEFRWLKERGAAYSGQWVAVLGEELLAHADTLKELLIRLEEIQPPFPPLAVRLD
ncbi:MAG TPA: DUF5678 domain-containing protein [Thermoanaerobaculia bacterium]|nr:DUF5678 domain-containing protein [Thermoanaerobaculia bacterium]